MSLESPTFEQVFDKWNWKEIRHCPGRFIFARGRSRLTCEEIIGIEIKIYKFKSEKVVDEILVARFATGGGLVSYVKEEHQFLHTLNNEDGFTRKLHQLGIALPDND